mmetsp:Transcript_20410/g.37944  ORF Transcript_20410/g.37944 Transcript_20410/m.37944 type:complete len:248 (+) Transcript_20410:295-1038(+)
MSFEEELKDGQTEPKVLKPAEGNNDLPPFPQLSAYIQSSSLPMPIEYPDDVRPPLSAFLQKLSDMTSTCPPEIANWNEEGTVFRIQNRDAFNEFLRKRFKGNTATFIRQLHFYSFHKLETDDFGRWAFQHPLFLRDRPDLLYQIKRKTRSKKDPAKPTIGKKGGTNQALEEKRRSQISELKSEMGSLRSKLKDVTSEFAKLQQEIREELLWVSEHESGISVVSEGSISVRSLVGEEGPPKRIRISHT